MVWLPTIDSAAHNAAYGHMGSWDVQGTDNPAPRLEPLSILWDGQLTGAAQAVVKLCQQYGVALASGHLGRDEIFALARFVHQEGFRPLVITHPNFKVPHLDNRDLSALAAFDVYFEFTYCTVSPMWRSATIDETAAAIQTVGSERCFLTSDGGQPHNPMPHEGLRLLAQMLLEKGIGEAAIGQMIREISGAAVVRVN